MLQGFDVVPYIPNPVCAHSTFGEKPQTCSGTPLSTRQALTRHRGPAADRTTESDTGQGSQHSPSTIPSAPRWSYLIEHVGHVLLAAGLLGVAELGGVLAGKEALVADQRHALIGHLVPFKVDLVVGTTCERETFMGNPPEEIQTKSVCVPHHFGPTEQINPQESVLGKS